MLTQDMSSYLHCWYILPSVFGNHICLFDLFFNPPNLVFWSVLLSTSQMYKAFSFSQVYNFSSRHRSCLIPSLLNDDIALTMKPFEFQFKSNPHQAPLR